MPSLRGRAVPVLAIVLAAVLAGSSTALVIRRGQRAYCSSATVQYEYAPGGFLVLNSYADVHERLCVTPRGVTPQFVDVLLRVTVQMEVGRNVPIFEPDSTWAEVEIDVENRATTQRCEFPELSRMTPYALENGLVGKDGALTKHCRFAVPAADRVTARIRFHGVERLGDHQPLSSPVSVSRDGGGGACTRGTKPQSCTRVDL